MPDTFSVGGWCLALGGSLLVALEKKMNAKQHCCERMEEWMKFNCSQHEDVFECPDSLVYYSACSDEYGLIVHDGGTSYVTPLSC